MTDIRDTVTKLIEANKDGQEGYKQAAENVKSTEYKSLFEQQANERARFVSELQQHLTADSKDSGSVAGAMHRAWIDLKSKLGAGDEAILSSVEQGEDSAKHAYEDALKVPLPAELVSVVQRQYQSVKAAHDRVKALRDRSKAA
jgi:uncharacterized protein (TIGR02284 family)